MSEQPDTRQKEEPRPAYELTDLIHPTGQRRQKKGDGSTPSELPHYPAVVAYIYMSRYATAAHVMRRFAHIYKSLRTLRYQLLQLVRLGYLKLTKVKHTGPNFPHVYICTDQGITFLRKAWKRDLPKAREEATTLPTIMHELFLTEFELGVWRTVNPRPDLTLRFTERRYHRKDKTLTFPSGGKAQRLIPDAGFLLAVNRPAGPAQLLYFVEMDNGTELARVVLDKFRYYETWANSELGQRYLTDLYQRHGATAKNPNFRLVMITRHEGESGDDHRLADLFTEALELTPAMRDRLWLATLEETRAHASSPTPLAAPIWYRVRDAKSWLREYRDFVASLPTGPGQRSKEHQRRFVADRLPQLPQHAMFPHPPLTNT